MAKIISFRRFVYAIAFLSVITCVLSCGSSNDQQVTNSDSKNSEANQDSTKRGKVDAEKLFINNELHVLYITNDGPDAQLGKLFRKTNGQQNENVDKLVFQFRKHDDGYLRLVVFPSTKGAGKFFFPDTIEVNRSNISTAVLPSGAFTFGDLHLSDNPHAPQDQRQNLTDLKNNVFNGSNPGSSRYRYIWLTPVVQVMRDAGANATTHGPYIYYQVVARNYAPGQKATLVQDVNMEDLNPSPPR